MNPGLRLSAAADFLQPGKKTVDVGTDHAYLPAFLVLSGKTERVLACDIGKRPLANAAKTVARYGLSDKIILRLSDGLLSVEPGEAEEISICGMGGTLMTKILRDCRWLCRRETHLVLQPQSHVWEVRKFLCENGFYIDRERVLRDMGKLYITISAFWDGRSNEHPCGYYHFGTLLQDSSNEAAAFIAQQAKHMRRRADSLHTASPGSREEIYLRDCLSFLK